MTPIEDLLREALATTPEPTPSTDPLGTLNRRVRRARRRLAAGAGVVAAVIAAAIVVPLTVGGGGAPNSVQVLTPKPSATPTPTPAGTTALWTQGAVWASTNKPGERWLLYTQDGESFITQIVGGKATPFQVPKPADYVIAGDNVVWVIGGSNGGSQSVLTAVDPAKNQVSTLNLPASLSFGAVVGDSLYVDSFEAAATTVRRFDLINGSVHDGPASPAVQDAGEIVATRQGQLWVHSGKQLVEIKPSTGRIDLGSPVQWGTGALLAPALSRSAPDGIWAYDGDRLIGLMPSALSGCVSCAEGPRVTVPGRPSAVVETPDGLYVALPGSGLYYYSPDSLGSGETPVSASIKGVQIVTMTADPVGGVDYVDDQGNLIHWQPVAR